MKIHSKTLLFNESPFVSQLWQNPGTYVVTLPRGQYKVSMRGGGGAGGETGTNGVGDFVSAGGAGGAGGTGDLCEAVITVLSETKATVYVGAGGKTYTMGGNGGAGGTYGNAGGAGGGGGHPTYIIFNGYTYDGSAEIAILYANGGGGGGGGGAGSNYGRNSLSGAGGGGGGYYRLAFNHSTRKATITSVSGQIGAASGGANDGDGVNGVAGNSVDFPTIYSGAGGNGGDSDGRRGLGGLMAVGGGASGGGGGAGSGNHSTSYGGGGGGGAGGSLTAGAGAGGVGRYESVPGYNVTTTPVESTNYLGQSSSLGKGGTTNANGGNGWLYITPA